MLIKKGSLYEWGEQNIKAVYTKTWVSKAGASRSLADTRKPRLLLIDRQSQKRNMKTWHTQKEKEKEKERGEAHSLQQLWVTGVGSLLMGQLLVVQLCNSLFLCIFKWRQRLRPATRAKCAKWQAICQGRHTCAWHCRRVAFMTAKAKRKLTDLRKTQI